ncbi:LOW QUALITY PROTEIN: proline-, glutamic acid- and leucine-rich protein 1 [Hypomesus transpacificus]|uniref:LOW QUALITY PROTEIN: proline-, glutamic acid- and leucine-rich protein 1 n=1 Tax=Hypomesus transpacificus TaxID=137520 RepID=UPI001F0839DD|nr:LOW QUALITY PROTEIN: proline-, glutamic acid- and leucine-rich protein 1 [Hypomesus transpacificus]
MATSAWLHGPTSMRLTEGLVSLLKEQRPEYLPALLSNYREHGVVSTQSSGAVGGLVGLINSKLSSSKTRFEGLCLLSVLVKDSSSEVFQQHCLSWLRSVQQVIQSQAPLPSIQLAVSVLQDLLQFSSQLPELAREVGLNSTLGILTSLLGLKSECHLAAMEGMTACMMYYPRACGSLRDKLGAYFLSRMDNAHLKIQEMACECYGRLPCLGGVLERGGGGGGRAEGWTNQIHCLLATANGMLAQLYQSSESEGTVQYEGPGVELPYPLLDDTDPLVLLQVQHRYRAVCLALTHTLSVDPASAVRLPVQQVLNLVCRALAVSCRSINMTGDGCVKLLMLPGTHTHTLEVLRTLISAVGGGMVQYSSLLQRLLSQTLSAWSPPPEGSLGQQRAFSAVRVSVFKTLELWVRVGGASSGILQGSPVHSELLFAHLLGDITPGADSVKLRAGPSTASSDLVGPSSKPGPRRSKGLAVCDVGGASIQRKGDAVANQDTCLSALRALRHIVLTSGALLKEDFHKRLHDVVLPLCVRLQQQARGDGGSRGPGGPSGQYGSPAPRRELYRLLLALVLVPPPRWPPPLTCAVSLLSLGRRDHSTTVSSFCTEALTICNSLLHPRTPSISLPLPPLTLKPAPVLATSQAPSLTLPTLLGGPAPGPPFPARHPLGLGPASLLGSLENHLPLVPPGQPGHLGAPGEMLLSPRHHQAELAGLGLPESQRPVFVRYDKEEADDVEISLNSDSDDSVVIVPPGMLSLGGQDCTAGQTGLPAGAAQTGSGQGGEAGAGGGVAGASAMDVSLPNDLPSSSTISITIPILPPSASSSGPNTINSFPPVSAPLVSLVPALNSAAQLTAPPGGLGDSLPGAQLQQMLLQTPAPGQASSLGINMQMQSLHSQLAQTSRQLQLQQQANEEDSAVININSSDEDEMEDEMEDEEEEEEGLEDEEGSDYAEEDFYEGEEYEEEMEEEEEEEEEEGLEDEEEDEEEEGEIPRLDGEGRRGAMGRVEGEGLRGEGGEEGGMGGFRGEGEREGGIEELGTGRMPYGDEGMKTQEVESIGVMEEEREGEREGEEEEESDRMNDPTMPQILCVTGGALEEREETEEEEGERQEVRLWEPGASRMEGTSSSEEGPSNQQEQREAIREASQETSAADDQPSNREGEEAQEGVDSAREEVSSSAQSEKEGEGSERERGAEEDEEREADGEDGKGVKRKREQQEEGGTEKKKLDEEVMASMLADFVACPPDDEDNGASASKQS